MQPGEVDKTAKQSRNRALQALFRDCLQIVDCRDEPSFPDVRSRMTRRKGGFSALLSFGCTTWPDRLRWFHGSGGPG